MKLKSLILLLCGLLIISCSQKPITSDLPSANTILTDELDILGSWIMEGQEYKIVERTTTSGTDTLTEEVIVLRRDLEIEISSTSTGNTFSVTQNEVFTAEFDDAYSAANCVDTDEVFKDVSIASAWDLTGVNNKPATTGWSGQLYAQELLSGIWFRNLDKTNTFSFQNVEVTEYDYVPTASGLAYSLDHTETTTSIMSSTQVYDYQFYELESDSSGRRRIQCVVSMGIYPVENFILTDNS